MSIRLSDLTSARRLCALFANGTSLSLIGGPGIGKSAVVRQFPRILGEALNQTFGYMEVLVPSIDAPDVRGFMIPAKDDTGRPVARYTYPAILPSREYLLAHPFGVLFLDEFNQGDHLTQKGLSPLLLDRMIGEFALPKTWWVITASNRMSDRSGVVKPLMHNINRQRVLEIDSDLEGWMKWAREERIHPMGIAFARQHPGVVFTREVPPEPRPFCSPRSFVSGMKLFQEIAGDSMDLPSDDVTQQLIEGDIGAGAAASFFGYIKVADHLPTYEEIIKDPQRAKLPPAERLDAAYAAQQMLLHHACADNVTPLWEYSERLPKELQVSTAMALLNKQGGALLNSPGLAKWASQNRALIINSTN